MGFKDKILKLLVVKIYSLERFANNMYSSDKENFKSDINDLKTFSTILLDETNFDIMLNTMFITACKNVENSIKDDIVNQIIENFDIKEIQEKVENKLLEKADGKQN